MDGIDWCSSNNSTPCALQSISVPLLITAMGGHYFIRDNEIHYEMAASKDKDFVVVEGATHGITPCTACEKTPGQYSNVTRTGRITFSDGSTLGSEKGNSMSSCQAEESCLMHDEPGAAVRS